MIAGASSLTVTENSSLTVLPILGALAVLSGCVEAPQPDAATRRNAVTCTDAVTCPAGRVEEPDLAALEDGRLAVTWALVDGEGQADVMLALVDPKGPRWGPLRRVNPASRSAVAGQQVGPRLASGPDGMIVVSWIDRARDPMGDLLLAVSHDNGRTFSSPRRVNDDPGDATGQEYHDLAVDRHGTIFVVWLDERDAPPGSANQKQLYASVSRDGGRSFSPNRALTGSPAGVCPCCRPTLAVSAQEGVHVIYRDREDDRLFIRVQSFHAEDRDRAAPVTVSDGWAFPGCPVNGPAITSGPRGRVWALWVEDARLQWARSDDRGTTFSVRGTISALETGFAGAASHLALAYSRRHGAVATWQDGVGQICFLALPSEGDRLNGGPSVLPGSAAVFSGSPTVGSVGGDVYVCWKDDALAPPPGRAEARPRFAVIKHRDGSGVLVPMAFD